MKITSVDAIPLAIPLEPLDPPSSWAAGTAKQIIVRIHTDAGLTGVGEAFAYGAPLGVASVIRESLAPMLVGQDATRIEGLVDQMHRATMIYGRRGLAMFAISGVDIALWDLLGKARQAPLHELLGGAVRPRLPVYASLFRYGSPAEVARACSGYVAEGHRRLKLHQTDVASVRAAREAVGPDVDLMLDTNCPWSPAEAMVMARALAPYRLAWLEEPVWPPEDYEGLARVAAATETPIALGENESTVFGFREIVTRGAADILQPSITKVGGVTEMRRIATLAHLANLPIAPHAFYFGPGLAATLHVAATLGGASLATPVEMPTGVLVTPFLAEPIVARDGTVELPRGPGLGVEINEEAIRRHPYAEASATPFVLHR
ncbi:MAG: mandelate racemase/muconate lactonizing enzyme family protein [Candidatus Rokubacteria bacterium]|nr:mandelate racemase/muconate lactonizing enzyme family protein [Candidatus Rokubacteria bacterium]